MPSLYKFRHFDNERHIRLITHRELWFARPSSFDDPLDCAIAFRSDLGTDEDSAAVYADAAIALNPSLSRQEAEKIGRNAHEEYGPIGPEEADENGQLMRDRIAEEAGVCSLSRNPNSKYMWSEYAKGNSGFVVQLDWDALVEWAQKYRVEEETKIIFALPIRYVNELPILDVVNGAPGENLQSVLLTKKIKFEDEDEYRLVALGYPDTALPLDEGVIRSVAIGSACSFENKRSLIRTLRESGLVVPLYEARRVLPAFGQSYYVFREVAY